jgi:predicted transcriptional regulator
MSKVVSMRLKDEQVERLNRFARRVGKRPSELAAQLLEEALRREEFPGIDIRETAAGREAFVGGTRLKVWHVVMHAREGPLSSRHRQRPQIPGIGDKRRARLRRSLCG